jgi:hypothetical protein
MAEGDVQFRIMAPTVVHPPQSSGDPIKIGRKRMRTSR